MQGRWQGGQQKAHEDDSAAIENENYFKCSPPAMADSSGLNQIQVFKIEVDETNYQTCKNARLTPLISPWGKTMVGSWAHARTVTFKTMIQNKQVKRLVKVIFSF